jgi:serine/threonine protein phosphatase 1
VPAPGENILRWNVLRPRVQEAKPRVPDGTRIYAVGDVHGRADLLQGLLARIDSDLKAYPIEQSLQIFLGDYIDRGGHSREVLDLLIARKRQHSMLYLKGNHETFAIQFLSAPWVFSDWKHVGGINTLLSYGVTPPASDDPRDQVDAAKAFSRALPESHGRFLQGLALSFTCGDYFFAHAGVRPGIPLRMQRQQDLLWIREEFLLHEETFGKVVVHGHTPAKEPDVRANRINIDTGAYATGRLTCLVLQSDQIAFI